MVSTNIFYNADYEKAILGCMLLDNSLIELIQGAINRDCFYLKKYGFLFDKIAELYEKNSVCDILALANACKDFNPAEIAGLTDSVGSPANWEFYAKEIKKFYVTRVVTKTFDEQREKINPDNVFDCISEADSSLTDMLKFGSDAPSTAKDLCNVLLDEMQKNIENKSLYLGYDTGWDSLSDILDGIQLGKLYSIGARPSVGKSALALQLAANLCKKDVGVSLFSLEMSALSLMARLTSFEAGVPVSYIQHGDVLKTESGRAKILNSMSRIYEYDMNIFDKGIQDEKDLCGKIRYQAKHGSSKVFIVDHLGLIPCSDSRIKRNEQIGVITKKLHQLAQELNVAIIVLCQLNRGAEGKVPTLAELKDSGTIEENSDIVMFIHRDRATGSETEIPTDILVVKNRDGKCGTASMMFMPQLTKYVETQNREAV